MSRLARKDLNTSFFHVMSQGINKEKIFFNKFFKEKYLSMLIKNEPLTNVQIIAYCIMDNHVHLLIYSESINNLSLFMKNVNTEYAQYYNWKLNKNNRNYDEIYHDETIRKDVIQILLKSKLLKKKDIQEKLNITWKILNRYIVE